MSVSDLGARSSLHASVHRVLSSSTVSIPHNALHVPTATAALEKHEVATLHGDSKERFAKKVAELDGLLNLANTQKDVLHVLEDEAGKENVENNAFTASLNEQKG